MSDPEKKSTYAAEDMVASWLDAVDPETGEVHVTLNAGGKQSRVFHPETEPRFSEVRDVGVFVRMVLDRLVAQSKLTGTNYRGREHKTVAVEAHWGWKKAKYVAGSIYLPHRQSGGAWALRGLVVLHELAHHLNTGVDGAIIDAHGEGFRRTYLQLLEDIGWTEISGMMRVAFHEVGLGRRVGEDDGMLARVGKLLRHAEGASTEDERDAFFTKAQQLATTHSIELAQARAVQAKEENQQVLTFEGVTLGHHGQHSNVRFIELMLAIARANDLRCSIRSNNTGVTLYGFDTDIQVVKALYVTLVLQMVADGDAYIRSGAHRPVHGRTARAAFYKGWSTRIGQRLQEAQAEAMRASGALTRTLDDATGLHVESKALALVAKDVEVADYYGHMKRQHGVSGTWRGSSQVKDARSVSRGRAAAERARLSRQQALPGR